MVKQVRLKIIGETLWTALGEMFGPSVVATFRFAVHPIGITNEMMDISQLKSKGAAVVETKLLFGASGKYKLKSSTVIKKLKAVIERV